MATESEITTDILVIGGGPAGSMAARTASLAGAQVLLVDKETFPRKKICGEGLSGQAYSFLVDDRLWPRIEPECSAVESVTFTSPENLTVSALRSDIFSIPRSRLDHILLNAAAEAGTEVIEGLRLTELDKSPDGVIARGQMVRGAEPITIRARIAIIATGSPKTFSSGGPRKRDEFAVANRTFFGRYSESEPKSFNIIFDKNVLPGYGWVFPSVDGRANVGVITYNSRVPGLNIRAAFRAFAETNPLVRRLVGDSKMEFEPEAHPIYTGLGERPLVAGFILRAGESAGLGFPFTGEGIYSAFYSGKLAGAAAARFLGDRGSTDPLFDYQDEITGKFRRFFWGSRIIESVCKNPAVSNRTVRQCARHQELADLYARILCEGYKFWPTVHPRIIFKSLF